MIKLVIFDMAGTSINENNLVYKSILKALNDKGHNCSLETVLKIGAGKEKKIAITEILESMGADTNEKAIDEIYNAFRTTLKEEYKDSEIEVFPSVRKVIHFLHSKEILVAFNTGYDREIVDLIMKRVDIDIDALCTSSDVLRDRPHPDMILQICEKLQIAPSRTIKVGDSIIDIIEGKEADVQLTIGVTTGAHTREQLQTAQPNYILDDMGELIPIISQINAFIV